MSITVVIICCNKKSTLIFLICGIASYNNMESNTFFLHPCTQCKMSQQTFILEIGCIFGHINKWDILVC